MASGGKSRTWAERDKACLWHPFTPMGRWLASEPLVIRRGEGVWLYDTEGNRYLDGVSSLWVNLLGHRHPRLDEAVRRQLEEIAHTTMLGLSSPAAIELAEELLAVAPQGLSRVFLSDNGSTAVEVALKMAYQYWRIRGEPERQEYVALEQAYHGDTIGSVSVGGIELFHSIFKPLLFPVHRIPTPHWYRWPEAPTPEAARETSLAALEAVLQRRRGRVAAVVLEPLVQGAAGMLVHPEGFLSGVEKLCREHDVLLICDEVATGFGRTGTLFAVEQEGVRPDFMAVAKGLTGGYLPVAATLVSGRVFEAFLGEPGAETTFFHGHSYTGNPLGCAAGVATLRVLREEGVLQTVPAKADRLRTLLEERIAPLAHVGQIRQKGLMVGIELVANREAKAAYPAGALVGYHVCQRVRRYGVILRPLGDVIVLMPPLVISDEELSFLVEATRRAIVDVTEEQVQ